MAAKVQGTNEDKIPSVQSSQAGIYLTVLEVLILLPISGGICHQSSRILLFSVINTQDPAFLLISHLGLRWLLLILHFLACGFHSCVYSRADEPLGISVPL